MGVHKASALFQYHQGQLLRSMKLAS